MASGLDHLLDGYVREIPDYPAPGVLFRDIGPLLARPDGLAAVVAGFADAVADLDVQVVAGIESRGFLLAAPLALRLGVGLVPLRKVGKLPPPTWQTDYELEYGTATLELSQLALLPKSRVLIVDDVLATGGTAAAAIDLLRQADAQIVGLLVLLELVALGGRAALAGSAVSAHVPVEACRRVGAP
jgi:adenine phosphoribosyltransferase